MSLAVEWGKHGIRLNTIAPGEIPTEGMSKRIKPGDEAGARTRAQNPMGRVGTMEELQNLAVFLISGGCDWINGETIAMDGAQALAMGGNFYQLRDWTDADWTAARDAPSGSRSPIRRATIAAAPTERPMAIALMIVISVSVKPTVEMASVRWRWPTKKMSATANTASMHISSTIGTASRSTARPMGIFVKSADVPRTASRSVDQSEPGPASAAVVVKLLRVPRRRVRPSPRR